MTGQAGPGETEGMRALARSVARDRSFQASDRLRRLLILIAEQTDGPEGTGTTQQQIAFEILGKDREFNPSIDPHARIEVGRLRTALKLYFAEKPDTAQRLEIPKGKYLLRRIAPKGSLPMAQPMANGVKVQVSVSGAGQIDHDAALLSTILCRAVGSPLAMDGALTFSPAHSNNMVCACKEAQQRGCEISVHLQVARPETGPVRALMTICRTDRETIIAGVEAPMPVQGSPMQTDQILAQYVADALADPVSGLVPRHVARIWPASRLALILLAYRFMCTQSTIWADRAMLGFEVLHAAGRGSATTSALQADMCRVSDVFLSSTGAGCRSKALDQAEVAAEREPDNGAAALSLGYARLAVGDLAGGRMAAGKAGAIAHTSSLEADTQVLMSLVRVPEYGASQNDPERSFLSEAAKLVTLFARSDWQAISESTSTSRHRTNFWIPLLDGVASVAAGSLRRSDACGQEIRTALPNAEMVLPGAIRAMFIADDDRAVFDNALAQMGFLPRGSNITSLQV